MLRLALYAKVRIVCSWATLGPHMFKTMALVPSLVYVWNLHVLSVFALVSSGCSGLLPQLHLRELVSLNDLLCLRPVMDLNST